MFSGGLISYFKFSLIFLDPGAREGFKPFVFDGEFLFKGIQESYVYLVCPSRVTIKSRYDKVVGVIHREIIPFYPYQENNGFVVHVVVVAFNGYPPVPGAKHKIFKAYVGSRVELIGF